MKKPAIKIVHPVSLDSQSGREFLLSVQRAAADYAKACVRAGVEPDDLITVFRERARIEYRKF